MAWWAPFLPEMGGLPLAGALIGSVVKLSKGGRRAMKPGGFSGDGRSRVRSGRLERKKPPPKSLGAAAASLENALAGC